MAQCPSSKKSSSGFTVIEVLVASAILAVGLLAAAALIGSVMGNTSRSEYMTQAATLASEKLEDLNHYPAAIASSGQTDDPVIAVPNGTSAGSLTSDLVQDVSLNGVTTSVNYFDEVYFSPGVGSLQETTSSVNGGGTVQYTTITHQPNGTITTGSPTTTPPTGVGLIGFERRWLIEANTPISGVRRVTVLVTLTNQNVQPPVTFQMSMVRP